MAFMSRDTYIQFLRVLAEFLEHNPDVPVPLLHDVEPEKVLPLAYLSDDDDLLALERLMRALDKLPHTVAIEIAGEDIDVRFQVAGNVFHQVVIGAKLAKSAGVRIASYLVVDAKACR